MSEMYICTSIYAEGYADVAVKDASLLLPRVINLRGEL